MGELSRSERLLLAVYVSIALSRQIRHDVRTIIDWFR